MNQQYQINFDWLRSPEATVWYATAAAEPEPSNIALSAFSYRVEWDFEQEVLARDIALHHRHSISVYGEWSDRGQNSTTARPICKINSPGAVSSHFRTPIQSYGRRRQISFCRYNL